VNEIAVASWNELNDRLHELAWNAGLNRLRSNFVGRGLPERGYELATSLQRLGGPYHDLEAAILASFRKYAGPADVEADSHWNWLAVAQHYGLPTRPLDWTYSPFVALHFVAEEFVAFLEPPSLDQRIVNQLALFSLMSSPTATSERLRQA
jgi:hypothetical protein